MGKYKWTPHRQNTLVCGVGFCDVKCYDNGKLSTWYKTWASILSRGHSDREKARHNGVYKDCSVDPRWHKASRFKKWFDKHYVEGYHLDKDILVPGNKVYGPDTCCFVPRQINLLFIAQKKTSNASKLSVDWPRGLTWAKHAKKILVCMSMYGKLKNLGRFALEDYTSALACYNAAKRDHIISVAREYYADGRITAKVKNALVKRAKAFQF